MITFKCNTPAEMLEAFIVLVEQQQTLHQQSAMRQRTQRDAGKDSARAGAMAALAGLLRRAKVESK